MVHTRLLQLFKWLWHLTTLTTLGLIRLISTLPERRNNGRILMIDPIFFQKSFFILRGPTQYQLSSPFPAAIRQNMTVTGVDRMKCILLWFKTDSQTNLWACILIAGTCYRIRNAPLSNGSALPSCWWNTTQFHTVRNQFIRLFLDRVQWWLLWPGRNILTSFYQPPSNENNTVVLGLMYF